MAFTTDSKSYLMSALILKPPPISKSSRVAVLAPASAPLDNAALEKGIQVLENRGLTVVDFFHSDERKGYLSASDTVRIDAINDVLNDSDIDAIFCLRGGYGCMRILDSLDYDAARRHPKLIVGYSDITALHCAFYRHAGWTGIHGPMVAVDWPEIDESTESDFWSLAGGAIHDPILGPGGESLSAFRTGVSEGRLIGGNLAVFVRLLHTSYFPATNGAILFLEETGEPPYRVDAMFAQLRLAGVLDNVGGIVLGEFSDCQPPANQPSLTLDEVFTDYFNHVPYPVATGLKYGHIPVKTSIPFGVLARLVVTESDAHLRMIESTTNADFTAS